MSFAFEPPSALSLQLHRNIDDQGFATFDEITETAPTERRSDGDWTRTGRELLGLGQIMSRSWPSCRTHAPYQAYFLLRNLWHFTCASGSTPDFESPWL